MTITDNIRFTCAICGYLNVWTRAEILRKGTREAYRSTETFDIYSIPCKNPTSPACHEHRMIKIAREV